MPPPTSSGYGGCSLTRCISPASPGAGSGSSAGPRPPPAAEPQPRRPLPGKRRAGGAVPRWGASCPLSPCTLPCTFTRPASPSRCRRRWKRSLRATKGHPVILCREQSGMGAPSPQPRGKHLAPFLLLPQGNDSMSSLQWYRQRSKMKTATSPRGPKILLRQSGQGALGAAEKSA